MHALDGRFSLGLVLTGGTFGSSEIEGIIVVDITDRRSQHEAELVRRVWTGPDALDIHVKSPMRKLSEAMTPHDWLAIASAVRELVEVDGVDGVLVLHGTDTATYTSAALSFLLSDLQAPVVITGANVPTDSPRSDGPTNVRDALIALRSLSAGVYLSFSGVPDTASNVYVGTTVRKAKAEGHAYLAPNCGPIGRVSGGSFHSIGTPWAGPDGIRRQAAVDGNVCLFVTHPGIDFEMLAEALITTGKRGAVVRMYPGATSASGSRSDSLELFVRRCTENNIVVAVCIEQYVGSSSAYPSLGAVLNAGAIFVRDIIPESAFVKLSWALAQETTMETVKHLMLTPVAGETGRVRALDTVS